jgi:hypothetical protein
MKTIDAEGVHLRKKANLKEGSIILVDLIKLGRMMGTTSLSNKG